MADTRKVIRYGFSTLLSEYVEAQEYDPSDMALLRIECPTCHTPLLLSQQQTGPAFIHEEEGDPAIMEACSEKDTRMDKKTVDEQRLSAGKDIALYLYISLSDAVSAHPIYPEEPEGARIVQNAIGGSAGIIMLEEATWKHKKTQIPKDDFYLMVTNYLQEKEDTDKPPQTTFSSATQKMLAYDLWKYVTQQECRNGFNILFKHACATLMAYLADFNSMGKDKKGTHKTLEQYLLRLMQLDAHDATDLKTARDLIQDMFQTPIEGPKQLIDNYGYMILASIMHELIGALATLPYYELLAEMAGITKDGGKTRQKQGGR